MATSTSPSLCEDTLDPQEELDFILPFDPILEADEEIEEGFTVTVRPEAGLLGLTILGVADGRADPHLTEDGKSIQLWLTIDDAKKNDPAFDGAGTLLTFEALFDTDETRIRNRTFGVLTRQL